MLTNKNTFFPLLDIYICIDNSISLDEYKKIIDEAQNLWCMHIHLFISENSTLPLFETLANYLSEKVGLTYSLGLGIFENQFFEIDLDVFNKPLKNFTALEFVTNKELINNPAYIDFIDKCNLKNVKLELYFKADSTNISDFDLIKDFCISKSIKLCILDIDKKAKDNKLSKLEYKEIFDKSIAINSEKKIRISMAECPYLNTLNANKSVLGGCAGGITTCIITKQGNVSPCYYLDSLSAGNIKDQNLTEIWKNSMLFGQLRERTNIQGKCASCENLLCCGGCRAESLFTTNDLFDSDENCWLQ